MPIFISKQHGSGPLQNDLESVLRIADLVQNSPGPNSQKFVVMADVAGRSYSYGVYLANSYTHALDLAWETHSKSRYPLPEVWGAMIELQPSDSDHTCLGSYHCLRMKDSSWFEFKEIVVPMASFAGFAAAANEKD